MKKKWEDLCKETVDFFKGFVPKEKMRKKDLTILICMYLFFLVISVVLDCIFDGKGVFTLLTLFYIISDWWLGRHKQTFNEYSMMYAVLFSFAYLNIFPFLTGAVFALSTYNYVFKDNLYMMFIVYLIVSLGSGLYSMQRMKLRQDYTLLLESALELNVFIIAPLTLLTLFFTSKSGYFIPKTAGPDAVKAAESFLRLTFQSSILPLILLTAWGKFSLKNKKGREEVNKRKIITEKVDNINSLFKKIENLDERATLGDLQKLVEKLNRKIKHRDN